MMFSDQTGKQTMTAMLVSIAMFIAPLALLGWMIRRDLAKITAALRGESWTANPEPTFRPVTVRFSPRYPSAQPVRAQPQWRAAA
jgi:hypothetical protein